MIQMDSGLVSMLRDDKLEDLSRMYTLFGRVANGHALMREVISAYIKDTVRVTPAAALSSPHLLG